MDNLTHTLAGMLVAEAACTARRESRGPVRAAAYVTSALANNLPDIDPIYAWITGPRPLGSLLHHRGHTHTLALALPAGLALSLAVLRLFARRHGEYSAVERRLVMALGVFGAALHIGMDFGNNYGVHPFWPVVSSWFYGDSIFIVEPLWWAAALPALASATSTRWLRIVLLTLLAGTMAAALLLPFITKGTVLALVAITALSGAAARAGAPRMRIIVAVCAWLGIAATFVVASARAEAALRDAAAADFPALRVEDVVASPVPGNPLCFTALVAGVVRAGAAPAGDYVVLSANAASLPGVTAAARCPYDSSAVSTAPRAEIRRAARPGVRWLQEYRAPLTELRALAESDCRFAALLRYARVPYVAPAAPGRAAIAGDLRYDRSPGLDFSDLLLAEPRVCPRFVPRWVPPRTALFGGSSH